MPSEIQTAPSDWLDRDQDRMEREWSCRVETRGSGRHGRLVDRDWNFDLAVAREEEEEGAKEMERW